MTACLAAAPFVRFSTDFSSAVLQFSGFLVVCRVRQLLEARRWSWVELIMEINNEFNANAKGNASGWPPRDEHPERVC